MKHERYEFSERLSIRLRKGKACNDPARDLQWLIMPECFLMTPSSRARKSRADMAQDTRNKIRTAVAKLSFSNKMKKSALINKSINDNEKPVPTVWLTFWRRNYFFLILAHPVYKMWIIQEPNNLELWNKLHFEEKKTESIHHV